MNKRYRSSNRLRGGSSLTKVKTLLKKRGNYLYSLPELEKKRMRELLKTGKGHGKYKYLSPEQKRKMLEYKNKMLENKMSKNVNKTKKWMSGFLTNNQINQQLKPKPKSVQNPGYKAASANRTTDDPELNALIRFANPSNKHSNNINNSWVRVNYKDIRGKRGRKGKKTKRAKKSKTKANKSKKQRQYNKGNG